MQNIKNAMSKRIGGFLLALGLSGLLVMVIALMLALLEILRQLGAWLFIDQNVAQYVRLDPNIAINSFPNNFFVLAYVLAAGSLLWSAKDAYRRIAQ